MLSQGGFSWTQLKAYLKGTYLFAIQGPRMFSLTASFSPLHLKNQPFSIYKAPGTIQCWVTWIFSFADHSRETVLIWQDGLFTGERKYAHTKCKYLNITPKWSMRGERQFSRSEIAFQLSIILLLVFLQIVNQLLFSCLSALAPAS